MCDMLVPKEIHEIYCKIYIVISLFALKWKSCLSDIAYCKSAIFVMALLGIPQGVITMFSVGDFCQPDKRWDYKWCMVKWGIKLFLLSSHRYVRSFYLVFLIYWRFIDKNVSFGVHSQMYGGYVFSQTYGGYAMTSQTMHCSHERAFPLSTRIIP